jgi:hypothetical protein
MNAHGITQGMVLLYPYLWDAEHRRGETEGRKVRPAAVAVILDTRIALVPITTKEPGSTGTALEIPDIEKRRAGLDIMMRQWLILDEINIDDPAQSYYAGDWEAIGHFSKPFFYQVLTILKQRRAKLQQVPRR